MSQHQQATRRPRILKNFNVEGILYIVLFENKAYVNTKNDFGFVPASSKVGRNQVKFSIFKVFVTSV